MTDNYLTIEEFEAVIDKGGWPSMFDDGDLEMLESGIKIDHTKLISALVNDGIDGAETYLKECAMTSLKRAFLTGVFDALQMQQILLLDCGYLAQYAINDGPVHVMSPVQIFECRDPQE